MGLAGRMARGVIAGIAGTVAMDLLWWQRSRRNGADDTFLEWEFTDVDSFADAGAPAQVARLAAQAVGVEIPDQAAGTTTDVVHWLTGAGYGLGHALVHDGSRPLSSGLLTGTGAFLTSYASLGALGIYDPVWEYDRETLAKDAGAHLVFGLGVGIAHALLSSPDKD